MKNRILNTATAVISVLCFLPANAQFDDKNLVANPSFEEVGDGLRRNGQFDLVTSWSNPTSTVADIFSGNSKSKTVSLPANMYGNQDPYDGSNYAGIVVYSPRNKMPRTYLTASLNRKLAAKSLYCIRFKASLADRSRFSSNNLGVLIHKSEIKEKTAITIERNDALYTDLNPVVRDRDGWWEFCQVYAATGGESYITIGNFHSEDRTISEAMEIPKAFEEAGGVHAAYYYIDMVQVEPIKIGESCNCAGSRIPESKVVFSGSAQLTDEMTAQQKIEALDVYFYQYKSEVISAAEPVLSQIIDIMNANPGMKVQIQAHSDNEEVALAQKESEVKDLAARRAGAVKSYMMAQGIDEGRLSVKILDNKEPASNMATPLSLAKNRRVEFKALP